MLDAISDFWKPSKKAAEENQLDINNLKPGSTVGFGFIPQPELSGRRIDVLEVNTYVFDSDRMTSFVLNVEDPLYISMIVSDSEDEKYIAISRRIPFAERADLFDNSQLLAAMDGDEKKQLKVKSSKAWSAWMSDEYKRAISGLKGKLISGDYRNFGSIPDDAKGRDFTYTLLVSQNNEFALEIEQYADNKMEVYATVYRRLSDIGEITPPKADKVIEAPSKPKQTAKTAGELAALKPANDVGKKEEEKLNATKEIPSAQIAEQAETPEEKLVEAKPYEFPPLVEEKVEQVRVTETSKESKVAEAPIQQAVPAFSEEERELASLANLPERIEPIREEMRGIFSHEIHADEAESEEKTPDLTPLVEEDKKENAEPVKVVQDIAEAKQQQPEQVLATQENNSKEEVEQLHKTQQAAETKTFETNNLQTTENQTKEQNMATFSASLNGNGDTQNNPFQARAIKPEPAEIENDTVECELPAANRVIEEAIRNEMSMSDVIRRVVALPVARQETVSIPVMLTDSDYSLLAVRYGIPAADRAAIKAKIIDEINDFTGKKQ